MKNYTDELIADYQVDDLIEAIDTVAAKQFLDTLENQKELDMQAFHKAYDADIKAAGLDTIFDQNTGKLKARGTYGDIKNCTNVKLRTALKKLWVAQFNDWIPTTDEANQTRNELEEIAQGAEFIIHQVIIKLNKNYPDLVYDYLHLTNLTGLDEAIEYTVDKNAHHCVLRFAGTNTGCRLTRDEIENADKVFIDSLVEDIADILKSTCKILTVRIDTLNCSTAIETYMNSLNLTSSDFGTLYVLDKAKGNIITIRQTQNVNDASLPPVSWKAFIYERVDNSVDEQQLAYKDLPDFNKVDILAADIVRSSGGRSWGWTTADIYYNHNMPDAVKKGIGITEQDESDYIGAGNGHSITAHANKDIPPKLAAIGLTDVEEHHYEHDSSD